MLHGLVAITVSWASSSYIARASATWLLWVDTLQARRQTELKHGTLSDRLMHTCSCQHAHYLYHMPLLTQTHTEMQHGPVTLTVSWAVSSCLVHARRQTEMKHGQHMQAQRQTELKHGTLPERLTHTCSPQHAHLYHMPLRTQSPTEMPHGPVTLTASWLLWENACSHAGSLYHMPISCDFLTSAKCL